MDAAYHIRFEPDGQVYEASGPVEVFLAAAARGILIEQPCGAIGTCGRCRVRVIDGAPPPSEADRSLLEPEEIDAGWRLACHLVLDRPARVEIPSAARSAAGKSFGGALDLACSRQVVQVRTVEVASASNDVQESDLDRVAAALGLERRGIAASPAALAELRTLLAGTSSVRLALQGAELIAARPGPAASCLGLALDIGSTSLAAALVDLADGDVRAAASRLNPQVAFGADVISRIHYAREQVGGAARLTAAVREGIGKLVAEILDAAGREAADVVAAACAGNPTMLHTWAGVDPAPLGTSPYVGTWSGEIDCRAREVGLPIHPNARVYAFPLIRSHVGADTVSAAVACGMDRTLRPTLLIDLGTNSEIMVAAGGRYVAASAAAGPAFEGATIRHGMRAAPGAIDAVAIMYDGHVTANTIGNLPAAGICGSGLIDAVAELLRVGAIATSGLLAAPDDESGRWPDALRTRLRLVNGQRAFVLADAAASASGEDLVLTSPDIRQLQLVKGSILAGVTILCRQFGISVDDLEEVLLAGAFGNYLRKTSALGIGLVPPIDPERVRFVGNAAGVGARLALVDREARARARAIASDAEYVELAGHADYQQIFMRSLEFPEPGGQGGQVGRRGRVGQGGHAKD
jgi:uncharacterized 2Fe-2S/4Fe-4S cluster protein (DUF4445 family)